MSGASADGPFSTRDPPSWCVCVNAWVTPFRVRMAWIASTLGAASVPVLRSKRSMTPLSSSARSAAASASSTSASSSTAALLRALPLPLLVDGVGASSGCSRFLSAKPSSLRLHSSMTLQSQSSAAEVGRTAW